jgi:hypothetical protein
VVSIAALNGSAGSLTPTAAYQFAGPVATVTTTSGQRLTGAAVAMLGLAAGSTTPQGIIYGLCYQSSGGGALTNFVSGNYTVGTISTTREGKSASATCVPAAGTWYVGFCVYWTGAGNISNNDYVNGWVMVTN